MADRITRLVHQTAAGNFEGFWEGKFIYTPIERHHLKIRALDGFASANVKWGESEFPGVYMSWMTKGYAPNMHSGLGSHTVRFVFGGDLCTLQKNYHLNLADCNGKFIDGATFFPDELDGIPSDTTLKSCEACKHNEIVFHDRVSIKLAREILFDDRGDLLRAKAIVDKDTAKKCKMAPKVMSQTMLKTLKKDHQYINPVAEAVRVFSSDAGYDGTEQNVLGHTLGKPSLAWCRAIAKRAGVPDDVLKTLKTGKAVNMYLKEKRLIRRAFAPREKRIKDIASRLAPKE